MLGTSNNNSHLLPRDEDDEDVQLALAVSMSLAEKPEFKIVIFLLFKPILCFFIFNVFKPESHVEEEEPASQINTPRFQESELDKKYRKSSQKETAFNRPKKDIWTLQQEMPSQLIEINEV